MESIKAYNDYKSSHDDRMIIQPDPFILKIKHKYNICILKINTLI